MYLLGLNAPLPPHPRQSGTCACGALDPSWITVVRYVLSTSSPQQVTDLFLASRYFPEANSVALPQDYGKPHFSE